MIDYYLNQMMITYVLFFVFSLNKDWEKNRWWVEGDGINELLRRLGEGEFGVSTLRIVLWSFNTRHIISWLTIKYSISFSLIDDRRGLDWFVNKRNLSIKSWSARNRYNPTWSVFQKKAKDKYENKMF